MRGLRRVGVLLVAALLLFAAGAQAAERRVALVVGNAAYKSAPLTNPVNDARAMARTLQELGFTVLLRENLSQQAFMGALREFGSALKEPDAVGLFYYAGHGVQVRGLNDNEANYLIPAKFTGQDEVDVRYGAVQAQMVLERMKSKAQITLVILDACRDNPFRGFRSLSRGCKTEHLASAIQTSQSEGSISFDMYLAELYRAGKVTYETAIASASDPKGFRELVEFGQRSSTGKK